jgi:translocation and assembly module TamB
MSLPAPSPAPRRVRLRRSLWIFVSLSALATIGAVVLFYWSSSASFEIWARKRLVEKMEQSTGGRVEIGSFHWRPFQLEAELGGVVIHGLEGAGEAPFAQVERLRVRLSVLDFWSPRFLLRDLDVVRPAIHFIVFPGGSTNQPRPPKPASKGKPAIDTIFDLKAGRIAVQQGVVDFEDRAAEFDAQNRFTLLDFSANDVSLQMSYLPAAGGKAENYHIEAGARDLEVGRGVPRGKEPPAEGYMQATLDLTRTALYVRSLRVVSRDHSGKGPPREHALQVDGVLEDFAQPRWQGRVDGDLDMRLLEPVTGYPDSPDGIARLDLTGAGQGGQFRIDGSVHMDGGSYVGPGVNARGVGVDAHVHADPEQLLITSIVARLKPGEVMEGTVALDHWLPPIPGAATMERGGQRSVGAKPGTVPRTPLRPAPANQPPVNGKVTAQLKGVSLDSVLDIVGQQPFERLGFDTLLSGPATATWTKGDIATLVVGVNLGLSPGEHPEAGEVSAYGAVDATYFQRNGSVDLRKLDFNTPGGEVIAHGSLGAYPVTSPTTLAVDFHSRDLREFDTLLRDLDLRRIGKEGVAALPVALGGEAVFHGTWSGSLVDPHLAGSAQAAELSIETAPRPGGKTGEPQWVRWDTVEAAGSYSSVRIAVDHGVLSRGDTQIVLSGTLDAALGAALAGHREAAPEFNDDSVLQMQVRATKVGMNQLEPLTGQELPLTGSFDTQLELNGPIRSLSGSGWAEMKAGAVFGQPVDRIRAQGTLANREVKLSSIVVNEAGGAIDATGQVNLDTKQFQLDSHGAGIDVAKIESLGRHGIEAVGTLNCTVTGSGVLDEPRLEAHASFDDLALNGQSLGPLEVDAHTANREVSYDLKTRVAEATLAVHGQTALSGEYETKAKLEFAQLNIGALLKMVHLEALKGDSALAGTVTLDGPMARPEELRGEARLNELAVTISGVHLKSEGGLHAAIANAKVTLDPLHVTGEETDLRVQGTLGLKDEKRLDFAANGSINLKLGQMLDPDLTASGTTTFQVEGHGPLKNPGLRGRIDFENGSLALEDVPNGLSQLHGTLEFNQDRLEVKSLTATSGGGQLGVTGHLAYQRGLYADLRVTGKGIRIRYPAGVSSLADATLRLQGLENNLQLSGDVLITRFSVSPDLDFLALAAQATAVQAVAAPDAPSNHIRLDVRITSSPQLNFQNTVAKLAGDVDLRLRGTVASPTLLGSVEITEGSAMIAGTRYDLERGSMSFTNPVRIEPSIDLSATAHVSDYDITLGLHGTPDKLAVTYRSDPPLPEADVVALLALGRTGNEQRLYTQQQEQAGANPTTDALLGGALNATVSSRVQKLFGAGSVKVDPNYLGALGNSTSRIIVEEQVGRDVTLTYATNVDTTQQQLLQAEIAINRHVSLLVARDESGVFSMVLKATRRYR